MLEPLPYFSDIALPFAAYFPLCASESSFPALRPWWAKSALIFGGATTAEILQHFGVYALGKTFDPLDIAAYATGTLLAVSVEQAIFVKQVKHLVVRTQSGVRPLELVGDMIHLAAHRLPRPQRTGSSDRLA